MKQHVIISTIFCLAMLSFNAQKRSIQAEDYKTWRSISSPLMSQDASLVGYQAKPLEGDATLYLFQRAKSKLDSFQRAEGLRFNLNSDLAVFKITPGFDTLRTLKLKKVKKGTSGKVEQQKKKKIQKAKKIIFFQNKKRQKRHNKYKD